MALNKIKAIAVVVVNCFLLTAVYGQAVAGVLENKRATEQFKQVFEYKEIWGNNRQSRSNRDAYRSD